MSALSSPPANDPGLRAQLQAWRRSHPFLIPPQSIGQGTFLRSYSGNAFLTFLGYNNSNAQFDNFTWAVDLSAGTWTLTLVGFTGTDRAITKVDFSQDNGASWTNIGNFDQYVAAGPGPVVYDTPNITIPKDGLTLIRFSANARNAGNATGWIMPLTSMEWQRTA